MFVGLHDVKYLVKKERKNVQMYLISCSYLCFSPISKEQVGEKKYGFKNSRYPIRSKLLSSLNRIGMPNFWSGLHQNISRFRFLEHVDLVDTYLIQDLLFSGSFSE